MSVEALRTYIAGMLAAPPASYSPKAVVTAQTPPRYQGYQYYYMAEHINGRLIVATSS